MPFAELPAEWVTADPLTTGLPLGIDLAAAWPGTVAEPWAVEPWADPVGGALGIAPVGMGFHRPAHRFGVPFGVPLHRFGVPLHRFGVPFRRFGIPFHRFGVAHPFGVPVLPFGGIAHPFALPFGHLGLPAGHLGIPFGHFGLGEEIF